MGLNNIAQGRAKRRPGYPHPKSRCPEGLKGQNALDIFDTAGTWNVPTYLLLCTLRRTVRSQTFAKIPVDGTWNVPTTFNFVGCVKVVLL